MCWKLEPESGSITCSQKRVMEPRMESKAKKRKVEPLKGQKVLTTFFKPSEEKTDQNKKTEDNHSDDIYTPTPSSTQNSSENANCGVQQDFQECSTSLNMTAPSEKTVSLESKTCQPDFSLNKPAVTPATNFGPWSAEECREVLAESFESDKIVHSRFTCNQNDCTSISTQEQQRIIPKKFKHSWLNKENWWLCYVEGEGMYCLLCRKHQMKHPQNQTEVFASTPSIRLKTNAISTHNTSNLHASALENEKLQKTSYFHHQILKKSECNETVLEQAFSTAYFIMKSFMANRQFVPMLDFVEKTFSVDSLKFFEHRSSGSQIDIFEQLGQAVKNELIRKVKQASAFGILTDEVADISVTENLVTFIQFYNQDTNTVETQFLSCQNVLAEFQSANAEAIATLILKELEENNDLNLECFTGFTSDGASVMVGKKSGVATRLKQVNPVLINVHCICHRLALACTDSNESLTYIKNLETWLRQLWQFFENSPQRMAAYLKIQTELKSIKLNRKTVKTVVKRLKKACRTRWLSLEASVKAVKEDYEALLQTLSTYEATDATASGLLKKMRTLKFIGGIYILDAVLQILGDLSRRFQKGSLSFAAILPAVNMTKDNLKSLLDDNTPMESLQQDIDSFTDMCAEIKMNKKDATELQTLFQKYTAALIENIDRRFADSSDVLAAFSIFDPVAMPDTAAELKVYGNLEIQTLSQHYYPDNQDKRDRLQAQWHGMKYYIRDVLKPTLLKSLKQGEDKTTPTEWLLLQLMRHTVLKDLYPELLFIVEVILSLPVSNAWPETGASTLKALKTNLRNRLTTKMLESLLHVSINAPEPTSSEGRELVKVAVKMWLQKKNRRKLPKYKTSASDRETDKPAIQLEDAGVQTEPVTVVSTDDLQTAVKAAVKQLNLDGYSDDEDEREEGAKDDEAYLWEFD